MNHFSFCCTLFSLTLVTRLPFVCDPANPTNNVAAFLLSNANTIDNLKRAASIGLEAFSKKYKSIELDAKRIELERTESNVRCDCFAFALCLNNSN